MSKELANRENTNSLSFHSLDQIDIPLEIIIPRDQILSSSKERRLQEKIIPWVATTLENACGKHHKGT